MHATFVLTLKVLPDGSIDRLYIGPEHAQTDRELEVIVNLWEDGSGRETTIFHVMPLGPKCRRLREESADGH